MDVILSHRYIFACRLRARSGPGMPDLRATIWRSAGSALPIRRPSWYG